MQNKIVSTNGKEKKEPVITVQPTLKPVMKCAISPDLGTKKNNKNK